MSNNKFFYMLILRTELRVLYVDIDLRNIIPKF